jgi:hypothetical protein
MKINIGATGNTVIGDILDVNKTALEARLRDYDPLLYLHWNPSKRRGYGCWELRRRPEKKSVVYAGSVGDAHYLKLEYVENDIESHVKDFGSLNYKILEWVKAADVWAQSNYQQGRHDQISQWITDLDRQEFEAKQQIKDKQRQELLYSMKQQKSAIRDYKAAILSGVNPALLSHFWK